MGNGAAFMCLRCLAALKIWWLIDDSYGQIHVMAPDKLRIKTKSIVTSPEKTYILRFQENVGELWDIFLWSIKKKLQYCIFKKMITYLEPWLFFISRV